jgi:hypothetical protein
LIALLHQIPPPSEPTSGQRYTGAYRRIRAADAGRSSEDSPSRGNLPDYDQSEMMGGEGWRALGWSFVSSGSMTVCHTDYRNENES